jgi:hypothetical protein
MTYRLFQREHPLVVRWTSVETNDIDEVVASSIATTRKCGRKLVYAGLQYDDFVMPDAQRTRALIRGATALAQHCSHFCVGLCARGVTASLHRSAVRSMLTLVRISRVGDAGRVFVADSVQQILEHASAELPADIGSLRRAIADAGMP